MDDHCFPRYGPIISTKAILDKATNRCKGYGFVDFESPSSALAAVNELSGQGIQVRIYYNHYSWHNLLLPGTDGETGGTRSNKPLHCEPPPLS